MHRDEGGGILADCITKHFRHSHLRLIDAPAIDRRGPQDAVALAAD